MTTSSRPGSSTEGAPLLAPRSGDASGEAPRRLTARFTPAHAVACALAALGFLFVFAGHRLGGMEGARSSTQRLSRPSSLNAPALSSEFVDRLNARPDRSWTARVPKGMESATHADLARLSGGRPPSRPKDASVWRASAFASTTRAAERHDDALDVRGDASVDKETTRVESALGAVVRTFGLSGRLGGFIEDFLGSSSVLASPAAPFRPAEHGLPDAFDAREKWPKCASLIGRGRDQGNCGSCWAMAPAEVMSDRLCIQTDGAVAEELSPFQLMACARGYGASGCDGGESSVAYEYAMKTGVVTGGAFGDTNTCAPYPFEACHHPCSVFPTPECPSTCAVSNATKPSSQKSGDNVAAAALGGDHGVSPASFGDMNTKAKAAAITSCPTFDYECIARELYEYGPVSTYAGDIYEEFYAYSDGVFRESDDVSLRGDNHGGHVMKIIGWGKDEASQEHYWTVVNSWLNWGQDGVGKIAIGQVGIGTGVEAAVMEIPHLGLAAEATR
jgi:cathepsin B